MTQRPFPFGGYVILCLFTLVSIGIAVWLPCWLFGRWCE